MKVYVFDLLPYDKHFEEAKRARYLQYPLPRQHFDAETAARTYAQHLEVWREMDRFGYDGVGLNEHHTTPHGLMNSPNMMAAVGAQHTKKLKFLILGNLLPLHNPLRIAEELSMADCLSRGRVISGFARGVPREYKVFGVPMSESRPRFEEAVEVILKAWKDETFSHQGKFWSYKDIAIWPRPFQQPHPPVWIPFTGSRETIEWAGKNNFHAVIPDFTRGLTEDIVGYFAKALAEHGHRISSEHLCIFTDAWVAVDRATAIREYSPYFLYFNQTLWHHGASAEKAAPGTQSTSGYIGSSAYEYIRPENRNSAGVDREKMRAMTLADVEARVNAGELAWGPAKEVINRLIDTAEHAGANSMLLNLNLGAMPYELFIEQIRRFGREVLPALQAHQVTRVSAASAPV